MLLLKKVKHADAPRLNVFSVYPIRKPAFPTIYVKLMAFWMYMKKICQLSYWMKIYLIV